MAYLYLAIAIISEVIGTIALKESEELSRQFPIQADPRYTGHHRDGLNCKRCDCHPPFFKVGCTFMIFCSCQSVVTI